MIANIGSPSASGNLHKVNASLEFPEEIDYRERYQLPIHWILTEASHFETEYTGYVAEVLRALPQEPSRVLDVGCGAGFIADKIAALGHEVVGVDYAERAIAFAQILARGTFHVLDARELEACREFWGAFDCVVAVEMIEHIHPSNQPTVVRGIWRALRPGGKLVITAPSHRAHRNKYHYKHYTLSELELLVQSNGFRIERRIYQGRVSWLFSPYVWMVLRNSWWDLVIIRRMLKALFLRYYNIAPNAETAKRYILICSTVEDLE